MNFGFKGLLLGVLIGAGALSQAADLGKIMFVGNSLAEGHLSDNLSWEGGYRKVMEDIMTNNGDTFQFVGSSSLTSTGMANPLHNGYGGRGISDLLNGVAVDGVPYGNLTEWITKDSPDTMVVELGRREWADTLEATKAPFMQFLDVAFGLKPEMKIIWNEQVVPDLTKYEGFQEKHDLINQAINEVAADYRNRGYQITVSKVADLWNWQTDLDTDGVHPNDAGYIKLGQAHYSTLSSFVTNPGPPPVPEPGLMLAVGAGAAALAARRKKRV